ncbi:HAD family hydrolase [Candidatus Uhrbacteria bacterium]|nr:HAD family hydrolase [Candidatus Uhrbacteria bacterium]
MFRLVVCDLDNTLYDWVSYFVPSFYVMVEKVVGITGWDREQLLDDLQKVHQKHHDCEHPFALLETALVKEMFPNGNLQRAKAYFDDAFHAFNSMRKQKLKTFPMVPETLDTLKMNELRLVAHTEAKFHAVVDRLRRLDLMRHFERVFCRERAVSQHPNGLSDEQWLNEFPTERITELSHHQRKPDPSVLREICGLVGVEPSQTVYIGDSIAHDIKMANAAGAFSIFAEYGTKRDPSDWDRLVRVTHWTREDVARETELREAAKSVEANFVAKDCFSEILIPLSLR